MEFPEKYTGNMLGKIPEKFSEISREIFQKIFLGKIPEKISGISQNSDPLN